MIKIELFMLSSVKEGVLQKQSTKIWKKSVLGYPRSRTDFCVSKSKYQWLQLIFVKISRTEVDFPASKFDYIRSDLERGKDRHYPSNKKPKTQYIWNVKGYRNYLGKPQAAWRVNQLFMPSSKKRAMSPRREQENT